MANVLAFIHAVCPDPEAWALSYEHHAAGPGVSNSPVEYLRLSYGDALAPTANWVCHGCPLSIAYRILRGGLIAGKGHHLKNGRTVRGHFVVTDGRFGECLQEARDRSTTSRCTEWQHGHVSAWGVPVVLAFDYRGVVANLKTIGRCQKAAIECEVGHKISVQELHYMSISLFIQPIELARYTRVQGLHEGGILGNYMFCGGTDKNPLDWASEDNNVQATCGRICEKECLRTRDCPFQRTNRKRWRCSRCL